MAKIVYGTGLGDNGVLTDFYGTPLNLQANKSDDETVIYREPGEDHNKITLTGSEFAWQEGSDFLSAGVINGVKFTTQTGDATYLNVTGLDMEAGFFNEAYSQNLDIQDVLDLLVSGNDTFTGSDIADDIASGAGRDVVHAGKGNDTIGGGSQIDKLYGDAGNDYIWSDTGNDRMWGGAGSDHFQFQAGDGKDVIVDFDAKGGGKKQDYLSLYEDTEFTVHKANHNRDTLLDFGDGDTLTLQHVQKADFKIGADVDWIMPA